MRYTMTSALVDELAEADAARLRRTEMGKIVISENVSLDGVIQDPTGEEGFRLGGWFGQIEDQDREAWAQVEFAEALGAEALLLGRRSYEWFAARWPSRSGEWADRLNSLPKYVVSSTLEDLDWNNSTVLKGDVVNEISKLKQEVNGEIVVYASGRLVHSLLEHDLPRRRASADDLPVRARGRRAPLQRGQRQEADAPGRHPDCR
ncbi:dihydrofolate reductase family protein [Streptomyces sp. B-S-A8]|uniref:Dihydrofolate reductase family protein n=1 Tax=Streptomyces solicavernae TaxID=3043614 RepID=A0ABT6RQ50_9ACTN|nr:dihydrofolate reductase family protein [Streptomyces sp. B-S-A8]MDI3386556.1 dihydrofolate reductase family protein [Streptomyces sp. B-S-A8]